MLEILKAIGKGNMEKKFIFFAIFYVVNNFLILSP